MGVTVMCGMVIAVTLKDPKNNANDKVAPTKSPDRTIYKQRENSHYAYNASGKKRKVVNVRYRD